MLPGSGRRAEHCSLGILLAPLDEISGCFHARGNRRPDRQCERTASCAYTYRHEVPQCVVGQVLVHLRKNQHRKSGREQQHAAVVLAVLDIFGANAASGPGPVFDYDRRRIVTLQAVGDKPGQDVRRAACRKSDHDADLLDAFLRDCAQRERRCSCSDRAEKLTP